jgi:hypothetical protein
MAKYQRFLVKTKDECEGKKTILFIAIYLYFNVIVFVYINFFFFCLYYVYVYIYIYLDLENLKTSTTINKRKQQRRAMEEKTISDFKYSRKIPSDNAWVLEVKKLALQQQDINMNERSDQEGQQGLNAESM